jgi:hypothetical protein
MAISQVEAPGVSSLALSERVLGQIDLCAARMRVDVFIVNFVDLTLGRSVIVTKNIEWQMELSAAYGGHFSEDRMWTEEIFLRKTHFLPLID